MSDGIAVLDASAVLALLKGEPGSEMVTEALPDAVISAVNLAEVLTKLCDDGWPLTEADETIASLGIRSVEFTAADAAVVAALRPVTRSAGLSLGDRSCLALAKARQLPAYTADRGWLKVSDSVGIAVVNIRVRA